LYCSLFNESEYWSKLAEERRVLAQDMPDDKCKQMMFQIAENYEHLAKRIAKDPAPAKLPNHAVPNSRPHRLAGDQMQPAREALIAWIAYWARGL
jgi:hypothetical protein